MARNQEEAFRYDKMVERALRGVVRQALDEVVEDGLVEDHHFYITFYTEHPGVKLPDYLKERYPGEMTIVLQHQFYDLEVDEDRFSVMLSFNNVPERLTIPLAAVTIFADPSVNFALQFQPLSEEDDEDIRFEAEELDLDKDDKQKKKGEVISLDSFRKKGKDEDKKSEKPEKSDAKPKADKKDKDAEKADKKDDGKDKGKEKDKDKDKT
ncbi:MAG TPA: ClpXP protease specificity-enhancing factor SspB [Alphaproteobacteria bacterium]|jgi:hypothetical protein|nr:ClpXP protease specificity-enhancing factor SspB [Alphaproteobacteria bacterium]